MPPRLRFTVWAAAVLALLLGQFAWLFLLRGPRILASDAVLIGGQALLVVPVLVIAFLLKTTPPGAIKLRRRTSEWVVVGGTALLQFAAVALLRPALSEDVLRYRTDGRMWLDGVSPYAAAPLDWPGKDAVDALVPFPEMRTIYPAVSQATFALAATIERAVTEPVEGLPPASSSDEQSPWRRHLGTESPAYRATTFRALFALAAIAMTCTLLLLLRARDTSAWWAALVAWNPLVTLEVGGMGHQDVVGVLLVLLSLYALAQRRPLTSMTLLALAAAVKPFAFFLAPFALRDAPQRHLAAACLFATTLAAVYLPPLLIQGGHRGWRATADTYSATWEANGSLYELITRAFGTGDEGRARERAKQMARLTGAAVMVATALAAWRFGASPATAGYWLCLAALLVAPVVYPWYLLWVLCLVPLLRGEAGWTALVWSGTVGLSYTMWHQPTWRMSGAALLAEYGVVYAVLVLELAHAMRRTRDALAAGPPDAVAADAIAPAAAGVTAG